MGAGIAPLLSHLFQLQIRVLLDALCNICCPADLARSLSHPFLGG